MLPQKRMNCMNKPISLMLLLVNLHYAKETSASCLLQNSYDRYDPLPGVSAGKKRIGFSSNDCIVGCYVERLLRL